MTMETPMTPFVRNFAPAIFSALIANTSFAEVAATFASLREAAEGAERRAAYQSACAAWASALATGLEVILDEAPAPTARLEFAGVAVMTLANICASTEVLAAAFAAATRNAKDGQDITPVVCAGLCRNAVGHARALYQFWHEFDQQFASAQQQVGEVLRAAANQAAPEAPNA